MEERARERRDGGFTSPRSSPRSCIAGRELPEFCALIVLRLALSQPQATGSRTSVRIKSRIAQSGCSHLAPRDQQAPRRNKFRAPKRVAARDHLWIAAGIEAPRRCGFGAHARPEQCVITGARQKSKAPSPLRSAGALQNLNAGAPNTTREGTSAPQSISVLVGSDFIVI
jgi:hypothetical protein